MTTLSASPELLNAWNKYYSTIEEMRLKTENTARFQDRPQHRAKAYHALMEAQARAYNFAVAPRLHHPRVQVGTGWQTDFYALGQNCPDFQYGVFFLDGRRKYRITGRFGDIRLLLLQTHNFLMGHPDAKTTGTFDFWTFDLGPGHSFDIEVSAERTGRNWIPLEPTLGYQFVLLRRAMGDWNDDPGEFELTMLDEPADGFYDYDEFSESAMAERISRAADWLPGTVTSQVGSPLSHYAMGVFDLKDDEALIVELAKIPDCAYWSLQLGDVWSRSLEFMHYQTSVNLQHAKIDSAGVFRAVVSKEDPGISNWLDTRGRGRSATSESALGRTIYHDCGLLLPNCSKDALGSNGTRSRFEMAAA